MTIKEIETRTGLPRANVRYYEAEGLITPERNRENGYRVYSEADADTLMKIRLLRSLDVSIEDLRSIQTGECPIEDALRRSLESQGRQQKKIGRSMELTHLLLEEKVDYDTLDASAYLQLLEADGVLKQDCVASESHPWRRFFARDFDYLLCSVLAVLPFYDFLYSQILSLAASFVLMLLLEPLCLHLFGTTPGKWIFGIRVTDREDRRLSYGAGLERTWTVLWEGEALRIPLIMYYFLYKSYRTADAGDPLPWEWDSEVSYKDDKVWRWALWLAAFTAVFILEVLIVLWKEGLL